MGSQYLDSLFTAEISADEGQTWDKIEGLDDFPYPQRKKILDDVTETDAEASMKAPVNFEENEDITLQITCKKNATQPATLEGYYDSGQRILVKTLFVEDNIGHTFGGYLSEFNYSIDQKKVRRLKITIGIDGKMKKTI